MGLLLAGSFRPADVNAPVAELVDALELKIEFRKECWFDSGQGHQLGCSSPFLKRSQPSAQCSETLEK